MFIQFPTSSAKKRINSTKFTDSCFLGSSTKFPRSYTLKVAVLVMESGKAIPRTLLSDSCQFGAKFGTCTVAGINETLVESEIFTYNLECTHFIFNKCTI
jgi:hypothetical protein